MEKNSATDCGTPFIAYSSCIFVGLDWADYLCNIMYHSNLSFVSFLLKGKPILADPIEAVRNNTTRMKQWIGLAPIAIKQVNR